MVENILMYSLAGLIVYVTVSMFMYKEEVEVRKKQILFKDEQIEYLREQLKEVNKNKKHERYIKREIGGIE